jgi:hypothetical protein
MRERHVLNPPDERDVAGVSQKVDVLFTDD